MSQWKEIVFSGIGGAVLAALLAWVLHGVGNHRRERLEVRMERLVVEARQDYLDGLRDIIEEAAEKRVEARTLLDEVRRDATFISENSNVAEKIVADLKGKVGFEPADVAKLIEPGVRASMLETAKSAVGQAVRVQRVQLRLRDCNGVNSTYYCSVLWDQPFKKLRAAFIGRSLGNSGGHAETVKTLNWADERQFHLYVARPWLQSWKEPRWFWEFEVIGIGE